MKFLILRFSSIGDIVLTTPVVRCLKKQLPDAELHYCTKTQFASLLKHNPYIDKFHFLDDDIKSLIKKLKEEKFDYIIDLHHNLRTLRIKTALGVKAFSFNKLNYQKFLLTNFKINKLPAVHIVDRYMQTLQTFAVTNDEEGLDFYFDETITDNIKNIPQEFLQEYIVFCIGGGHFTKKLPVQKIISIAEKMETKIILLGGKDEIKEGELIEKSNPKKIYNACGKLNIYESAFITKNAKLVCTNDTGMMHIAAALKKPIVSFWGNTVPEFGMYPYYGKIFLQKNNELPYSIIENKNLSCRPCSKIGYSKCPKKHFNCMEKLQENEITLLINSKIK